MLPFFSSLCGWQAALYMMITRHCIDYGRRRRRRRILTFTSNHHNTAAAAAAEIIALFRADDDAHILTRPTAGSRVAWYN
jgi:DNA-directed RNA polymerase specialized sigma24 family protein